MERQIGSHFSLPSGLKVANTNYAWYNDVVLIKFISSVVRKEFLPYLDKWEESVNKREDFKPCEQKRMLLSQETLLGLRMTGKIMNL